MLIIFEGFEKAGKTTLAKKIKEKYNFLYFKPTKQINSGLNLERSIMYDWRFLLDLIHQNDFNLIIDRSFISQYVYSMVLRLNNILKEYNSFDLYNQLFYEYCEKINNIKSLVVYCTRENYQNVVDENVDININKNINEGYNDFFEKFKINNIVNCKFEDGIEKNLKKIEENM